MPRATPRTDKLKTFVDDIVKHLPALVRTEDQRPARAQLERILEAVDAAKRAVPLVSDFVNVSEARAEFDDENDLLVVTAKVPIGDRGFCLKFQAIDELVPAEGGGWNLGMEASITFGALANIPVSSIPVVTLIGEATRSDDKGVPDAVKSIKVEWDGGLEEAMCDVGGKAYDEPFQYGLESWQELGEHITVAALRRIKERVKGMDCAPHDPERSSLFLLLDHVFCD